MWSGLPLSFPLSYMCKVEEKQSPSILLYLFQDKANSMSSLLQRVSLKFQSCTCERGTFEILWNAAAALYLSLVASGMNDSV